MEKLNIEIKARCEDLGAVRAHLTALGARFVGEDHQIDTYFRVERGRLKLREGTIERALIFYERREVRGLKRSDVILYHPAPSTSLPAILSQALGVRAVVDKRREIYFIDNVKFHLDRVEGLGAFVEIEAIGDADDDEAALRAQCAHFLERFGLPADALVAASYSDLLTLS